MVEVKKRKEIVSGALWSARQKAAKSFIASFGGDKDIERIMGDKTADVKKALSGEKAYGSAGARKPPQTATTAARESNANGKGNVSKKKGVKRKERS